MRLLLDTQIFLWWLADSRKLGKSARELIESADEVYISAASIVECELKIEAGLLEADPQELYKGIAASGFKELPVRARPAAAAASLKRTAGADGFDSCAGSPHPVSNTAATSAARRFRATISRLRRSAARYSRRNVRRPRVRAARDSAPLRAGR